MYDVLTGVMRINGFHPFVAAFYDDFSNTTSGLPLELFERAARIATLPGRSFGIRHRRQIRNVLTLNLRSVGTPILMMGDGVKMLTANRSGDSLSLEEFIERAKIQWHMVHLWAPNLSVDSHSLAATGYVENEGGFH